MYATRFPSGCIHSWLLEELAKTLDAQITTLPRTRVKTTSPSLCRHSLYVRELEVKQSPPDIQAPNTDVVVETNLSSDPLIKRFAEAILLDALFVPSSTKYFLPPYEYSNKQCGFVGSIRLTKSFEGFLERVLDKTANVRRLLDNITNNLP